MKIVFTDAESSNNFKVQFTEYDLSLKRSSKLKVCFRYSNLLIFSSINILESVNKNSRLITFARSSLYEYNLRNKTLYPHHVLELLVT